MITACIRVHILYSLNIEASVKNACFSDLGDGAVKIFDGRGPSIPATLEEVLASIQSTKYRSRSAPGRIEQLRRARVPALAKNVRSSIGIGI